MGVNVPSAKGVEWKGRDMPDARLNYEKNYTRIFGKREDITVKPKERGGGKQCF